MKKSLLFFAFICCIFHSAFSQKNSSQSSLDATKAFLATLNPEQLATVSYPYDSEERSNWYYIPKERNGLWLKSMNEIQRKAAIEILKSTLSEQGKDKAIAIMQLEIILKEIENVIPESDRRNPLKYYFTVFGTPSATSTWGWRIEGHHLSLNFTSQNNKVISGTPLFMGTNPAIVPSGNQKGYQILKDETNLGFELLASLSEGQKKKAIFSEDPFFDILSANCPKPQPVVYKGIGFDELNDDQQKKLMKIVALYVKNYPLGFADEFMRKIEKAGLNKLRFAWSGEQKNTGKGNYYCIQNDVLLIEYDNTQNNANHVHSVVRDLTNDFGEDFLRKHYQKEHSKN
ncbi:DUF3500 domain-containing protein [Arcicella rigui]|uniref:DUF3500 domain-containing protein n=1 Tax=Arcicella rigui TaxID=797020 RepID=A0ABU5Q9W8_9BACT|nr:DUF3500 domain-containing protein [Arcicella rigui]MEA5139194.1 DUF3500 domain-containing protein [Arcicella rigui]